MLLVNRLLVVKLGGGKSYTQISDCAGLGAPTPMLFRAQQYFDMKAEERTIL